MRVHAGLSGEDVCWRRTRRGYTTSPSDFPETRPGTLRVRRPRQRCVSRSGQARRSSHGTTGKRCRGSPQRQQRGGACDRPGSRWAHREGTPGLGPAATRVGTVEFPVGTTCHESVRHAGAVRSHGLAPGEPDRGCDRTARRNRPGQGLPLGAMEDCRDRPAERHPAAAPPEDDLEHPGTGLRTRRQEVRRPAGARSCWLDPVGAQGPMVGIRVTGGPTPSPAVERCLDEASPRCRALVD